MASSEKFLPVPTDEPEVVIHAVPTYSPNGPGFNPESNLTGSLSVDAGGVDGEELFANTANEHMLCCSVCCDFRRAVLVVDAISIVYKILAMVLLAIMGSYVKNNPEEFARNFDDDITIYELESMVDSGMMTVVEGFIEVFDFIAIGLYICGIYGALNFKRWGLITAIVTYAVQMAFSLLMLDFFSLFFYGMMLYPHFFMLKQMKSGIMTDYNYHKIASCCGDRKM